MKKSIKLLMVLGLGLTLSACIVTEEDRIRDHRIKCEMYGFMPGTANFARCVQKKEVRYEKNQIEADRLSIARERNYMMRERMERHEDRKHRHHHRSHFKRHKHRHWH